MAWECECEVCGTELQAGRRMIVDPTTFDAYCGPDCLAAALEMDDDYAEGVLERSYGSSAEELTDDELLAILEG